MGIIVNLKFIRGIASDMGKIKILLFQRNENIICLMGNSVSITINIYFFFLCIILRITFSFY